MSFTFTKLFSGLTESTVWVEPYPTRILWVSMLSWADQHGRVWGSAPGIARRAGINLDEAEAALTSFLSPDRHSRTADFDGRRIEKIDGGWRLLNYGKYREMRDAESRREQNREAQQRHRDKMRLEALGISQNVSNPADDADNKPGSAQAEAEAEVKNKNTRGEKPAPDGFLKFWSAWPKSPRKGGKPECLKRWLAKGLEADASRIVAHVELMKRGTQWQDPAYIPLPATYLNGSRWDGAEDGEEADPFKGMLHG